MEDKKNEDLKRREEIEKEERVRSEIKDKIEKEKGISSKSRFALVLLVWFVGFLGVHRFYLGKIGTGLIMMFSFGGFGVWWLIDFILAISGSMEDGYGLRVEKW